jgi:hypothetical protein
MFGVREHEEEEEEEEKKKKKKKRPMSQGVAFRAARNRTTEPTLSPLSYNQSNSPLT